jgi:hypothetical protein
VAYDVRSVTTTAGTGSSFTLATPAGATATDSVFVAVIHTSRLTIAGPIGWSLATANAFNTNITVRLLQTTALATSGPWTFTLSGSDTYVAAALAVQADSVVPGAQRPVIDTSRADVPGPTTGPFVFQSITPSNTGDLQLLIAGWGRYTTIDENGPEATQRVELSSGTSSTDKTLWVGSLSNATTAGTPTITYIAPNQNPGGFTAEGQGIIVAAIMSAPPPLTWVGDFEASSLLSQYSFYLGGDENRIQLQTGGGADQGSNYASFRADDGDVFPLTPTDNPRASLVSPRILYPDTERWLSWSTRFPTGFPVIPLGGWLVFWQYHGPPYTGSPSTGFGVEGSTMVLQRNQSYNYDRVWSKALVHDTWYRFVMHIGLAQDETGYIELWVNGIKQAFLNGTQRLYMRTIETDQTTGCEIDPLNYRLRGMFSTVTLDHDALRMDSTVPTAHTYANQVAPPVQAYTATAGVRTHAVN